MVETVEIKQPETTREQPVEEKSTQSKPEGLPEKFNSVEDLAKSYSELEKKLGEQSPKVEEVDPVNKTTLKEEAPKQENSLEIAENAVENAGLDFNTLADEYAKNGQLGDESYKSLEESGIQKNMLTNLLQDKKQSVNNKLIL